MRAAVRRVKILEDDVEREGRALDGWIGLDVEVPAWRPSGAALSDDACRRWPFDGGSRIDGVGNGKGTLSDSDGHQ